MIEHWSAPEWACEAVFYQIFPDRFFNGDPANDPPGTTPWDSPPTRDNFFGGDLAGIRAKLDYLEQLGVGALYLTPFFRARTNHRYDTSDYLEVDPVAGTLDEFRLLVADAHRRDMRLILDAVFNHCGDGFWAFEDVVQHGATSSYADWFSINSYPITMTPPSYQTCGGAAFLPKLNHANPAVREYLLHVTRYWLEQGADGWRLDVPWKIPLDFWRAFRAEVLKTRPDAYIVAEAWRGTAPWLQGDTVHGVMNYRLRAAILDYCAWDHMDAEDFDYELAQLREEHGASAPYHLTLLGSHDTARILTVCGGDVERARLAAIFQFTYIGAPMIYYGDEIGMVGENDPLCRAGMIWDERRWNARLYETYRRLITLRRAHAALKRGGFEPLTVFNAVYAYHRFHGEDSVVVILNPREARQNVRIPLGCAAKRAATWEDALTGERFLVHEGRLVLNSLPSRTGYVLLPREDAHD
ncbi:MAG: alpha-amylase family glycosyl hydrolase [Chloroflexota bacterium]